MLDIFQIIYIIIYIFKSFKYSLSNLFCCVYNYLTYLMRSINETLRASILIILKLKISTDNAHIIVLSV